VAVVRYGHFRAELGGDLSGFNSSSSADIETSVAPKIGRIDVYKVHHHGSAYSSNDTWLATVTPRIGIISAGNRNSYGHPSAACLARLHSHGVHTYWTELGAGATPDPAFDEVAGSTVIQVARDANEYTVTISGGAVDVYPMWEVATTPTPEPRVRRHFSIAPPAAPSPVPSPTPITVPTPTPTSVPTQSSDPTVYVTNTGTKYHRLGCQYLIHSSIPTTLSWACSHGYTPCSVCNPPLCPH
jgi:competence protein ComEC